MTEKKPHRSQTVSPQLRMQKRLLAYYRDRKRITSAQRRRIRHKMNHAMAPFGLGK